MTRWGWLPLATALVTACGDDAPSPGPDASPVDTADTDTAPSCVAGALPDRIDAELRACGVCVEDHVRVVNPRSFTGTRVLEPRSVPAGVVVAAGGAENEVTFVSTDGQVVPLFERPDNGPSAGFRILHTYPAPVPASDTCWIVTNSSQADAWSPGMPDAGLQDGGRPDLDSCTGDGCPGRGGDSGPDALGPSGQGDAVLYRFGADGWQRLASARVDFLDPVAALATGDLVGRVRERTDAPARVVRVRPSMDGRAEVVERPWLGVPDSEVQLTWALPDGRVAWIVGRDTPGVDGAPWPTTEEWLVLTDADLEVVAGPTRVGVPLDDPGYETAQTPRVMGSWLRPTAELTLLLAGAVGGMDAGPMTHFWVNRISAAGELLWDPPGVWVNPDQFLRSGDFPDPGAGVFWTFAVAVAPGIDAVIWDDRAASPTGLRGHSWLVDRTGAVRSPAPDSATDDDLYAAIFAADGGYRAYHGDAVFREPDGDENRFFYRVQQLDENLRLAWPQHVVLQECTGTLGENAFTIVGAQDDGVWAFWSDTQTEQSGRLLVVDKVALIRSDGSYAWAAE